MNELDPVASGPPVLPEDAGEHVVIARSAAEMRHAQDRLVAWAHARVEQARVEVANFDENLSQLKGAGWSTARLDANLKLARSRLTYYEKILAALQAGFVIVPEMPAEVFAVRTSRAKPKHNRTVHERWGRDPDDQEAETLPAGEGRYVSPRTDNVERRTEFRKNDRGQETFNVVRWADEFREVSFPFALARPEIVEDATKAAALLIFDELAVVQPATNRGPEAALAGRKPDPIVVGSIVLRGKGSWGRVGVIRRACFLLTWFVDVRTI